MKPAAVVTSHQPFFDPGAGTSMMSINQTAEVFMINATQPVEAPSMMRESPATMTAQPVDSLGAKMPTQPVEAPYGRTDVHSQPTSTGSGDGRPVKRSLTSSRTVAADDTCVSAKKMNCVVNQYPLMWPMTRKFRSSLKKPTT